MKIEKYLFILCAALLLANCASTTNNATTTQSAPMARDQWPRQVSYEGVTYTISQPQVEKWEGNIMTARCAVGAQPAGDMQRYGVVWFTARTEINKETRMVVLQDFAITRIKFDSVADGGLGYRNGLKSAFPANPVQTSLDRLQASYEVEGGSSAPKQTVTISTKTPRIIFATSLSVLVLVDGKPVLREIKGSEFRQVINTGVVLLTGKSGSPYYLWLSDRWVQAPSIAGPWSAVAGQIEALDAAKKELAAGKKADLLENISPEIKKSMQQGQLPGIYVSAVPARLVQTNGTPDLEDIPGTGLRFVNNSNDIIIFDMNGLRWYVLIDGRWYRTISRENGPWSFVAGADLPADFARIPPWNPAGRGLYAVPGTPQARQAVVEATTPHTQTIEKTSTAQVTYDGIPKFNPIEGTTLRYAVNASQPVICIDQSTYYMVQNGVWFYSATATGPWSVATSVPPVIYTIPANSPMHYVTYVYVYGTTPTAVYTGYTPGYYGEVVTPSYTVVYSTGYMYPGWVGACWFPPPNYYYYNDDYYQVHETYDGKYVQHGYSDYGNYTKVGDTTFARTQDGHYATKDGNVYKREAGGWKEYNPDTGDWQLSNFSKAVDTKRLHDHRMDQPTAFEQHRDNTGRGGSGTGDAAASSDSQGRFGNRDSGGGDDRSRELDDSFQSREEGERRFSGFSGGGGFGGDRFGGGGFGGGRGGRR